AYGQLSQATATAGSGSATSGSGGDRFSQALGQIGSALQSGDLSAAQQTLSSLHQGHGHHRSGGSGQDGDAASGQAGSFLANFGQLAQSLQS
ncbi:hypothetical protein, partial [Streptomyces galilaeus]|uniref:hypothetical protein n=1 Tax=Streptomyces galilaeus TaxID=33899 RepID=UPI0038F69210